LKYNNWDGFDKLPGLAYQN